MKQIINGMFFSPKPQEVTQAKNVKKLAKSNGINLNRRESNELSNNNTLWNLDDSVVPDLVTGIQPWKCPRTATQTWCGSKSLKFIRIDSNFWRHPVLNIPGSMKMGDTGESFILVWCIRIFWQSPSLKTFTTGFRVVTRLYLFVHLWMSSDQFGSAPGLQGLHVSALSSVTQLFELSDSKLVTVTKSFQLSYYHQLHWERMVWPPGENDGVPFGGTETFPNVTGPR